MTLNELIEELKRLASTNPSSLHFKTNVLDVKTEFDELTGHTTVVVEPLQK